MSARKINLRTFAALFNFDNVSADVIAEFVVVERRLFTGNQNCFGLADFDDKIAVLDANDFSSDKVALAIGEFVVDNAAFSLAQFLNDELFGSLRGDSAEIFGRNFNLDNVIKVATGTEFFGFFL